jgi:hypothetical protein
MEKPKYFTAKIMNEKLSKVMEDDWEAKAREVLTQLLQGKMDIENAALWLHLRGYNRVTVITSLNKMIDSMKKDPSKTKMVSVFIKLKDIFVSKY